MIMALVTTKEMFEKAMKENYAIGAFNVNNMEFIQGIVDAASEENSPVILQASSSAIKYARINYLMKMVEAAVETTDIPIAIHLDHGPDFETCKMCIDAGFTSVMFDGSKYDFEENVRLTKEVVDYAHAHGVVVEAELGTLAGVEDEVNVDADDARYTNPEQAKEFVDRTGCDSLAIAIGTSHGAYKFKGEAKLRFDILEEVKKLLPNTPIVLHGASTVIPELVETCNKYGADIPGAKGVPDEILHEASQRGVSKINVDTDLRLAMTSEIRKVFIEEPSAFDPRKYLKPGREKIKETVKHKIRDVFGSSNKA
jgi:fructose-bisphosphate aldolase class II